MAKTYTVKKGDTLSEIALANGTTVAKLVALNGIKNPDYIVVGQVLKLEADGTTTFNSSTTMSKPTVNVFGLQANTDRTVYAAWTFPRTNVDHYEVIWYYYTDGDGIAFTGNKSDTNDTQSVYNAPSNAASVSFKVKPISKTYKVNNKDTNYWTAYWSTAKYYYFTQNPPTTPSAPTITIENSYRLIATLDGLDDSIKYVFFEVIRDNKTKYKTGKSSPKTGTASSYFTIEAGSEYKVRCRVQNKKGKYSEWSAYSSNIGTIPKTPSSIKTCKATSETSVYISWSTSYTATSYEIQYSTELKYLETSSDRVESITGIETTSYEKTGLESGEEYFFRVRAVNSNGNSGWSQIKSVIVGKKPAAPTTWSSTTTAITGEPLIFYWVHNSVDGSSQTYGELELHIGDTTETYTIKNTEDEEEKDKTSFYEFDTSPYLEGTKIQWRVRTSGVTKEYGDWSVQRTVDIYAPATLELGITDQNGDAVETLTSFPFYISGLAGPNTQVPIGYHLTISSNETYETVDNIGNSKMVNAGEAVYSKYFDTNDPLTVMMSANNVNLENNVTYTVTCVVSMDSGLTAESSIEFTVAWTDEQYEPNAEIFLNRDDLSVSIRPYCVDTEDNLLSDILLSVYRREFDGSFTELATEIDNLSNVFVTDPHPALDYARYRVVAMSSVTGAISYYDVPGYPVGESAVVIQWSEAWTAFDVSNEDELEEPTWSGSMLKLPYNIDVSDSNSIDVSLIEYIGREHPVSYYGTQLGSTSSWSVEIPKDDKETLYALRRLSIWMGDVYVREPSGSGYWANISVSFSQKHRELTIPVSLSVTRVEGGI